MKYEHAGHWYDIFRQEFGKETDRARVILSATMLDNALETLLKVHLVPVGTSDDNLFDGAYAPLNSFSAKVDIAHRLGLISARFCRDLHIIRRIRNDFAHNISNCTFEDTSVRNRIIELTRSSLVERDAEMRKGFPPACRGDFEMMVSWMLFRLWGMEQDTESIKPAENEWGYWTIEKLQAEAEGKNSKK